MLQQTTVGAVGPYFRQFIDRWPSVQDLAAASLDDVMRMWAGLGYYRRARALHEGAHMICRDHDGRFPPDEAALRQLPGCGPYTAAAVAAIAFDRRANVVDGNVERVMARLFAVEVPLPQAKRELTTLAATLLPNARYGDYAQALMDLGAMVCAPRNPKCGACPWADVCRGRASGMAESLPRRAAPKTKPVRRAIAFFLTDADNRVLLRQRPAKGLLAGMMEVPSSAWREAAMPQLSAVRAEAPLRAAWRLLSGEVRHSFSHFDLELRVAMASISRRDIDGRDDAAIRWVSRAKLDGEALPSVMRKIIRFAAGQRGGS